MENSVYILEGWCGWIVASIINQLIYMDSLNCFLLLLYCSALFSTQLFLISGQINPVLLKFPSKFSNTMCTCVFRTSNSTATLSSCASMEPCVSDEHFQAHSHAEHTFRRMEAYLRTRKLCDVVLLAGERRIPAHR